MRFFVTGGTGFIGRALVARLLRDGHEVRVWTRSPKRAARTLGPKVQPVEADLERIGEALEGVDAVLNLAGEGIFDWRWSDLRKKEIRESRILLTRALTDAIAAAPNKPAVLVSTSAVGYYGDDRGSEKITEESSPGEGFLAEVCRDWEAEALKAEAAGVRTVIVRVGIVIGKNGGALQKMLTPFKLGIGGKLGSGQQYFPWIHRMDLVELFTRAATDETFSGVYLGVAPKPVTNTVLTKTLGSVLTRPTLFPVPAFALRLLFGESASALLGGHNAHPERTIESGFEFRYRDIRSALDDVLKGPEPVILAQLASGA